MKNISLDFSIIQTKLVLAYEGCNVNQYKTVKKF